MLVTFNFSCSQNIEKELSRILKEMDGERDLKKVTVEKNNIILEFGEYSREAKSFVKQFSKRQKLPKKKKKKTIYHSIEDTENSMDDMQKTRLEELGFKKLSVIETNKCWLVFWTKIIEI